jgi:hypothetical protein
MRVDDDQELCEWLYRSAAEQSLAADGAIACFSSNFFPLNSDGDRAPQLKASVRASLLF